PGELRDYVRGIDTLEWDVGVAGSFSPEEGQAQYDPVVPTRHGRAILSGRFEGAGVDSSRQLSDCPAGNRFDRAGTANPARCRSHGHRIWASKISHPRGSDVAPAKR